jgi:hypothetical protein
LEDAVSPRRNVVPRRAVGRPRVPRLRLTRAFLDAVQAPGVNQRKLASLIGVAHPHNILGTPDGWGIIHDTPLSRDRVAAIARLIGYQGTVFEADR